MATEDVPADRLVSRQQAARRLGVSVDTVKRMASDGDLTEIRLRNQVRIRESEVDAIVNGDRKARE